MSVQDIQAGQRQGPAHFGASAASAEIAKQRSDPRVLLIEPTIRPVGVELLKNSIDVGFAPDSREETLIEYLGSGAFSAVITRVEKMTRRVIEAAQNLKIIGQNGTGVDNIDLKAASECGILVLNEPTSRAVSVAEHTVMLILALCRNAVEADRAVRRGDFQYRERHIPLELNGKTAFVLGFGRCGRETTRRLRLGFNMRVLVWNRGHGFAKIIAEGAEPASLEEGFSEADVVTLHMPHLPATTHLVSRERLARMKPNAYLVNTARGPVIDQPALIEALREGRLAGAGLDVFDPEPPSADDPLMQLPNVILSPHLAGDTVEAKDRCSSLIASQVLAAMRGELPEHVVNRDAIAAWLSAEPARQRASA
jgi:D-3-phosphoglycerate dehydrogenase